MVFGFRVGSTLTGIPGDFDNDGDVDGRDFLAWQRGEFTNPLSASDLAAWQTNYGVGSLSATIGVPEPCGWMLIIGWATVTCVGRLRSWERES